MAAFASSVVASIAIRVPCSSPRSASTPSTHANTERWVSRSINRRVREIVEWSGVYSSSPMPTKRRSASESASRQAIPRSLSMPSKYPQQRPEVDARRQRGSPVLGRVELCAPPFDKLVEALRLQQLVQPLIKRIPRRRCQLGVRYPDVLLFLPLL